MITSPADADLTPLPGFSLLCAVAPGSQKAGRTTRTDSLSQPTPTEVVHNPPATPKSPNTQAYNRRLFSLVTIALETASGMRPANKLKRDDFSLPVIRSLTTLNRLSGPPHLERSGARPTPTPLGKRTNTVLVAGRINKIHINLSAEGSIEFCGTWIVSSNSAAKATRVRVFAGRAQPRRQGLRVEVLRFL